MKILVTGATGFIGRAFCQEAVRRGHRILALTRDPTAQIAQEVEIAIGSLADTPWDQVARFAPDAALHLAWVAEPGVYLHSPENDVWLELSKSWFRRLIELGVPYIAGTGTCIEYAASTEPLHEERSPLNPQFPYSKAKVALLEWMRSQPDLNWAWFRVFYPYGTGEHPNRYTSIMVRQLRAGKTLAMNTPDSVRDYIEISDAAAALCHVIEGRTAGVINIGSGFGITVGEIARQIAFLVGVDEGLVQKTHGAAPDAMPCILSDARRLKSTGWRSKTSLADGLQHLIDSLLHRE
jgi:nucleoside-diphosphate-sugar epimerase